MKLYYTTRTAARKVARLNSNMRVIDCRNRPYNNKFGWGVVIDTNR